MHALRLLAASVVVVLAAGCGTAKAGDKCNTTGYLCADGATALECRSSVWTALPCKGAAGCKRSGETVTCDMSGNAEGDACASSADGKGLCSADGKAVLECRAGALVKTATCTSCTVSAETVLCQR